MTDECNVSMALVREALNDRRIEDRIKVVKAAIDSYLAILFKALREEDTAMIELCKSELKRLSEEAFVLEAF